LEEHARILVHNLFHSYGIDQSRISGTTSVTPPCDECPLLLGVHRAIPAGLILNELISNSLKHAFPDGRKGSLRIELARVAERIEISVMDDGVGMPADFETRQSRSLGVQIVKILTKQLKGNLQLDSKCGTRFTVSFPDD